MNDEVEKESHPIDVHVGKRVRLRRTLLRMSQEVLGDKVGISFQQIQKYERGVNRIGASRLYEIAVALDVPVTFFYDDMDDSIKPVDDPERRAAQSNKNAAASSDPAIEPDVIHRRDVVTLVRSYDAIASDAVRQRALEVIQALGGQIRRRRSAKDVES